MKRVISTATIGGFLASNVFAFNVLAANETSVSGTTFNPFYNTTADVRHYGDGLFNNTGATIGVTGSITLDVPAFSNINVQVRVFSPSTTSCSAFHVYNNGANFVGYAMTKSGTAFTKTGIGSFSPNSDTLTVYCDLAHGARLAMLKVYT